MKNKVNNEPAAEYEVTAMINAQVISSQMSDADLISRLMPVSIDSIRKDLTEKGSLREVVNNSSLLGLSIELTKRYMLEDMQRGDALCSPAQTRQYLQLQLGSYEYEVFAVLFLDNRNRVIAFDKMFRGTIDGASVYPREVVREALKHNAAAVIFSHNHPSGVAEPSHADEQITQRLKDALALVDIRVLDHFVVGDEIVSFAERGLL